MKSALLEAAKAFARQAKQNAFDAAKRLVESQGWKVIKDEQPGKESK